MHKVHLPRLIVERQVSNSPPKLGVVVIQLLQPAQLRWQQPVALLLLVEVGRRANACLPANLFHRHAIHTLL